MKPRKNTFVDNFTYAMNHSPRYTNVRQSSLSGILSFLREVCVVGLIVAGGYAAAAYFLPELINTYLAIAIK